MTIFNFQFSIFKSGKGFTLIELMVVLSVTAVLGTFGIAGFVNYNKSQVIQASANEVVTMLSLARSRAQSQIKPSALCAGIDDSLKSYTVIVDALAGSYRLEFNCSNGVNSPIDEQNRKLPAGLSFDANKSFVFPVTTGGVQASGQIIITSSDGKTKTIVVNAFGGVSVQ